MTNLRLEVWQWLDGLKNWQLDLVKQLLQTPNLNDNQINEAISMLLATTGLPSGDARVPDPISKEQFLGVQSTSEEVPSILRLYDLENVSAVERGQSLDFAQTGMTIVFGNNAAGKSSYARVLKQSCRTVDDKVKILPNIYADNSTQQAIGTAKIDIQHGQQSMETVLRSINTPPEARLRSISIFDSKCGSLYLTNENDVAYVPNDLIVLQRLASNQDRMKAILQEKVKSIRSQLPVFSDFIEETSIKQRLRDLSATSKAEEFVALANLSENDMQLLAKLEAEVLELTRTDPSKGIAEIKKKISDGSNLLTKVRVIQSALSDEKITKLKQLVLDLKAAKQANELARSSTFSEELLSGVGSASWKTLWDAARQYFCDEAYPSSSFPPDDTKDERCPLCHQTITDEAAKRLKRFEQFISDKTELGLRAAELSLAQAMSTITSIALDKFEEHSLNEQLKDEAQEVWSCLTMFFASAKKRQLEILSLSDNEQAAISDLDVEPTSSLQEWLDLMNITVKEKEQLLQPERHSQLQKEIAELKARQMLQKRLQHVLEGIDQNRQINAIETAGRALSTTAMTAKMSEFIEKAVTTELSKCLEEELIALNCSDIPVKIGSRGEKGKTKCKMTLQNTNQVELAEVLSQGEQRGLSLAFFLAEVGSSQHDGPIILDDPVSSLDHLRRTYVADRLARESLKRQVIVFTHDIVFLLDLQSATKRASASCTAISVRKAGKMSGITSKSLPWPAQKCTDRKRYLKNDLVRLANLEHSATEVEKFEREIKAWYVLLREAWERGIEERLFGGVVERFRYGIETQRLKNLKVTDDKLKLVIEGMTTTSARVHDEGSAMNRGTASVADAEADLKKFEDFLNLCPAS